MTHEYLRAVESYNLSYMDLKRMARAEPRAQLLVRRQPLRGGQTVADGCRVRRRSRG